MTDLLSRFRGSLAAACIADALGAPTEELSRRQVRAEFGAYVTEFHAPLPGAPYAHGRSAAQITDDSSQMLMLSDLLARTDGKITAENITSMLIEWSSDERYFPHFAGPTTRAAIDALAGGADPWDVGKAGSIMTQGASNGAAMRIVPVGLFHHGDIDAAVETAFITCVPSHNTSLGVSGAAAIAAAVAVACTDGATVQDVVAAAKEGAKLGEELGRRDGRDVPGPSIARRIDRAITLGAAAGSDDEIIADIEAEIGVGLPAAEAVPAAVGFFAAAGGDPVRTAQLAANAGGDSDTIGCMAAGIAGAHCGYEALDEALVDEVEKANDIDIAAAARLLLTAAER